MKTLRTIMFIAAADTLLVLAALLLVAGYPWQAASLGAATVAWVAVAAWRSRPESVPTEPREWLVWDEELEDGLSDVERQMLRYGYVADPVDRHAAQMIRALSGKTAVLPEIDLLTPTKPSPGRYRQDNR